MEKVNSKIITYGSFIFALSVVILSIVSLIFPALLVTSLLGSESNVNSFELGAWAIPLFAINIPFLIFGVLYKRKKIPNIISKSFKFILNFEVSRNTAIIVFTIMTGIYVILTVDELSQNEIDVWKDWEILGPIVDRFPSIDEGPRGMRIQIMNNFLLFSSQELFQNVKIIPFLGSISLVFVVYFFTAIITKKRFAGLIAMAILLQSHTFLRYDTSATYSNFWTLFYLVSLFLVYKKWPLSPLVYVASIFSKALTVIFLPMTLFFIFRSNLAKKTKIIIIIFYIAIFLIILSAVIFAERHGYIKSLTSFDYSDFLSGFTAWAFQLRIDGIILVFLLPLTIGLFIKSHQGLKEADSILVLIAGILLSAPFLVGFTEFNIQPYRWIPLIAFFAIGVGALFSKKSVDWYQN